jgi:hypothetical protein
MTRRGHLPRPMRYPNRTRRPPPEPPQPPEPEPEHRIPPTLDALTAGLLAHRETHAGELDIAGCTACRRYLAAIRLTGGTAAMHRATAAAPAPRQRGDPPTD